MKMVVEAQSRSQSTVEERVVARVMKAKRPADDLNVETRKFRLMKKKLMASTQS